MRRESSDDYDGNSGELPGGASSMANFINNAQPVFASYGQLVRPPPAFEQSSVYHSVSLQVRRRRPVAQLVVVVVVVVKW